MFNDRFMTPASNRSEQQDVNVKIKHMDVLQISHGLKNGKLKNHHNPLAKKGK